ncbi:hypothetical protein G4B88_010357 [Cannabis sativa]|uniref:Uncharacterized protein n=1 Tax=Cannabis sativa TaxID=3483 RepID=A0A7J6I6V7_CANSA|nr:hypothetical protein G4B88_010357 [Cannabis sativa]
MLLEKAYEEFGFQQRNGLVVPCSVSSFREVVNAVQCSNDQAADQPSKISHTPTLPSQAQQLAD